MKTAFTLPKPIRTVSLQGPAPRKMVFVQNPQAQQPRVLFSGDSQGLSLKTKATALGALLTAIVLPAGVAKAQDVQPANNPQPGILRFNTGNGPIQLPNQSINNAADLQAFVNQQMKSPVAVLANNSLLSKETQQELHKLLVEFEKQGVGQMAIVEIADTNRADMNDLATDIFNQIQLGEQGKNNGVLLLINNKGVREGTRGKQMTLKPGAGVKNAFNSDAATRLLIENAVPHLKKGDYDTAVKETVKASQARLAEAAKNNDFSAQERAGEVIAIIIITVIALMALFMAAVMLSICCGGKGGFTSGGRRGGGSGGGSSDYGSSSSSSSSDSGGGGGGFSDGGGGSI